MKESKHLLSLTLLLLLGSLLFSMEIQDKITNYEPNRIVVKFKPEYKAQVQNYHRAGFGLSDLDRALSQIDITGIDSRFHPNPKKFRADLPDLSLIYLIDYKKNVSPYAVAVMLMQYKYLEYAEPAFIDEPLATPDDTKYALSTYLTTMQAPSAWDIFKGENDTIGVVLGHVDTGVKWTHPDLIDNIWNNPGEDADHDGTTVYYNGSAWVWDPGDVNGVDDDHNGYIDDLIGWDFEANSSHGQRNDPTDGGGHGTNTAGIANARTNNATGVASIPWNVKLMPLSMGYGGEVTNGYRGIVYASENGADVINCSWGGIKSWSQANEDVIANAYGRGSIICAAAGNSNFREPLFPAAYPKVVAVGSVSNAGVHIAGTSYGSFVDVSAPSQHLWTTTMSDTLIERTGFTSYVSPIATGLSGLIKSAHHDWSNDQVVNQLIATCDNIDASNPTYLNKIGDGRINAYQALSQVNPLVHQELRLIVFEALQSSDANANNAIERGEEFSLNLKIRNYTHGVSSNNVTFTLSTTDTTITILNDTAIGTVVSDGYSILSNAFQCRVSNYATTHNATFTLNMTADLPVAIDSLQSFSVLINGGGIFIWEGRAEAGYSGRKIRDTLTSHGYSVFYDKVFPASFHGYSAVFLSFGMVSTSGNNVTRFDKVSMVQAVKDYLMEGGRLYIEGNDAVGFDIGFYLPDVGDGLSGAQTLWPLLGISTASDGSSNTINGLAGQPLALTNGLSFTSTAQTKLNSIDKYTPASSGGVAFIESGYGNVAIQNYGSYDQKSFVFSYTLAELNDSASPSTRDSLIVRIMHDFGASGNLMLCTPEVTIEYVSDTVSLSWDAVPNALSYRIESSENPYSGFTLETTVAETSWEAPETYPQKFYRVIAKTSGL